MNLMRSRHLQMYMHGLMAITLLFVLSWESASADELGTLMRQQSTCQIPIKSGWSPHRVQAEETLAALAARSGVTVATLMQANCLDTETIEVGTLVVTPKLGPAIPTATPTTMPTATPTMTPTPLPTVPLIVVIEESSALTTTDPMADETAVNENRPNGISSVLTTTASADNTADNAAVVAAATALPDATPTATATKASATPTATPVAGTNSGGSISSALSLGQNGLIALSLIIMSAMGALFFALRPRHRLSDYDLQANARVSRDATPGTLIANMLFMLMGFVIGAILFPMLRMPSLVELPTWLSATAAISLIGLLAVKEVLFNALQWRGLNRLLNLGVAPLLMIFLLSVLTRFADIMR